MSAAQYASERDEQKLKAKKLRDELADVVGGGKKVAAIATKLEVKYEQLKLDLEFSERCGSLLSPCSRSAACPCPPYPRIGRLPTPTKRPTRPCPSVCMSAGS